ncbi:MAG: HlyD family efflux transporter periplasmic adaptor subunit [Burkholderiales bacterium]|nr:HlyD family efflux transporter periplasmic adaptor subunit [Burkholderiales bacterium]
MRAPVAGRVTGLRLQVGESVRVSQNLGRIDETRQCKVVAQVDEFYLNRIAVGQRAEMQIQGTHYDLSLSHILPQIKDGRFSIELQLTPSASSDDAKSKEKFDAQAMHMRAGQSVEVHVTLAAASQALLLPNAAFASSAGTEKSSVFVVTPDGRHAQRRAVTLGRRNRSQIEVLAGLVAGETVIISSYAAWAKVEQLQLQ